MEMAKARSQLDAVLQCLLDKSHMDRWGLVQPGAPRGWELCLDPVAVVVVGICTGAQRLSEGEECSLGRLLIIIKLWALGNPNQ